MNFNKPTTIFEQPKRLNVVTYQRVVRAVLPIQVVCGGLLCATLAFIVWGTAGAWQRVAAWQCVVAAGAGLLIVIGMRLELFFKFSRRRYIEFRGDRLFLAQRGPVAIRRFVAWSLSPDRIEPRYTRLQLVYKFGLGRKRWAMLLDDEGQIAELRHALTEQIPQRDAA